MLDEFARNLEAGFIDTRACRACPGDFGFHTELFGIRSHGRDDRARVFHRLEVRNREAALGNVFARGGEGRVVERSAPPIERNDMEADVQRPANIGSSIASRLRAGIVDQRFFSWQYGVIGGRAAHGM